MPETTTAPAPAAPAAPPSPAQTPVIATVETGANNPRSPLYNPVLEEHFKTYDKPKDTKAPTKTAEKSKADDKPKAEEKPKEEPKAKPEAAKETKLEESKVEAVEFKTNKELRTAYETTKVKVEQYEKKIKEFEAKLAAAEKNGTPVDEKIWQDKIDAKQKELTVLQSKLAEADFTNSSDYQERFYKPYVNAWQRAMTAVTAIQGTDETGNAKPVSKEDAEFLLSLPDAKATQAAKQLFGEDNIGAMALLISHKNRIAEAYENLTEGRKQFQKIAEDKRQQEFTQRQTQGELVAKLWRDGNKLIAEKSPWFRPDESDQEGSDLLAKGFQNADRAFTDDPNTTPEQRVALHVELRNRSAAFDRLVHTVDKLTAERDALKKERDELLDSAPKGEPTAPKVDEDADKLPSELIDKINWGRR